MSEGFWFLATPYSRYPRGQEAAFRDACAAAAICFKAGLPVFSPIVHTHYIAIYAGLEGSFGTWADFDEAMIEASRGLIVVEMDGWRESAGINAEIALARALGLPVFYMAAEGPAPEVAPS